MSVVFASADTIAEAARLIREGRLVGMPTETVYGIAADALNVEAVRATFALKGRPPENPLIVHVSSMSQARELASAFPEEAVALAERFWPGPLTLVLPKRPAVPDEVTGGLNTVALRMPSSLVAQKLIRESQTPLSAPSANLFMRLSPTMARMIEPEIAEGLALILDGGPCKIGIESTVVSFEPKRVTILRPGRISEEDVRKVLGERMEVRFSDQGHASPGMYRRHYSPRTRLILVQRLESGQKGLTFETASEGQISMPRSAAAFARRLYAALDELDRLGEPVLYVQEPPQTPEWRAVWDRLTKAVAREVEASPVPPLREG